jgi:hypothetical protein
LYNTTSLLIMKYCICVSGYRFFYWILEMFRMCGIFCFYYFNVPGGTHDTSVKSMFFPLQILISLPVFAGGRVFLWFCYLCFVLLLCMYCCRLFQDLTCSLNLSGSVNRSSSTLPTGWSILKFNILAELKHARSNLSS